MLEWQLVDNTLKREGTNMQIAFTGAVEHGQIMAVTGVSKKWESLRSLGTYSRLIVAPGKDRFCSATPQGKRLRACSRVLMNSPG